MKEIKLNWADFKMNLTSRSGSIQYYTEGINYCIFFIDGQLEFSTKIEIDDPKNTDQIDFEDNYMSICNYQTKDSRTVASAFASKTILKNGMIKSLFKRVHGVNLTIAPGTTGFIEFIVPYTQSKFTGANIFGGDLKDTVDFFVLDTDTNAYSGAPGSYYILNQFGFDVEMPPGGVYENTSNYDADLYPGMTISCAFKNNGTSSKYISMNLWIHEVK